MADKTAIEWTDHTFNPWWGCANVSPGCVHCYAHTFANRVGQSDLWHKGGRRRLFGDKHWAEPLKWNRAAEAAGRRARVFCASMADVFEDHPDVEESRVRLWTLIYDTPWLDWQLLTKRPENIPAMVPWVAHSAPHNVWLGTSVEDQRRADERIWRLLDAPAAVRFLSCEPLLGPVDLTRTQPTRLGGPGRRDALRPMRDRSTGAALEPAIDWVIVGGESGHGARPMNAEWVRSLRDQCVDADVAFLFKQWGGRTPKAGGRELDGHTWTQYPSAVRA